MTGEVEQEICGSERMAKRETETGLEFRPASKLLGVWGLYVRG